MLDADLDTLLIALYVELDDRITPTAAGVTGPAWLLVLGSGDGNPARWETSEHPRSNQRAGRAVYWWQLYYRTSIKLSA